MKQGNSHCPSRVKKSLAIVRIAVASVRAREFAGAVRRPARTDKPCAQVDGKLRQTSAARQTYTRGPPNETSRQPAQRTPKPKSERIDLCDFELPQLWDGLGVIRGAALQTANREAIWLAAPLNESQLHRLSHPLVAGWPRPHDRRLQQALGISLEATGTRFPVSTAFLEPDEGAGLNQGTCPLNEIRLIGCGIKLIAGDMAVGPYAGPGSGVVRLSARSFGLLCTVPSLTQWLQASASASPAARRRLLA